MISVLRLLALPSGVALLALGEYSPFPEAVRRVGAMLYSLVSIRTIEIARATLKSQLS